MDRALEDIRGNASAAREVASMGDDPAWSLRVYSSYIRTLARALKWTYAGDVKRLITAMRTDVPEANPRAKPGLARVERSLRRAWATEHLLETIKAAEFAEARMASIPWLPSQVYYALHSAMDAALLCHNQNTNSHTAGLRAFSNVLARHFTYPLGITCKGGPATYNYDRMKHRPQPSPVTGTVADTHQACCDQLAVCLRTTREWDAEDSLRKWLKDNNRKRMPAAVKQQIIERSSATTLMSLFYRLRWRSNYGDVDLFLEDATSPDLLEAFSNAYVYCMRFMLGAFEVLIERRIGERALFSIAGRFPTKQHGPSSHFQGRWYS